MRQIDAIKPLKTPFPVQAWLRRHLECLVYVVAICYTGATVRKDILVCLYIFVIFLFTLQVIAYLKQCVALLYALKANFIRCFLCYSLFSQFFSDLLLIIPFAMADKLLRSILKRNTYENRLKEMLEYSNQTLEENFTSQLFIATRKSVETVYDDFKTPQNLTISFLPDCTEFELHDAEKRSIRHTT